MSSNNAQLLLRKKATEELKKEQEMKAAERRKVSAWKILRWTFWWDFEHLNMIFPKIWSQVIDERCGKPKSLDGASEGLIIDHQMKTC